LEKGKGSLGLPESDAGGQQKNDCLSTTKKGGKESRGGEGPSGDCTFVGQTSPRKGKQRGTKKKHNPKLKASPARGMGRNSEKKTTKNPFKEKGQNAPQSSGGTGNQSPIYL